MQKSFPFLVVNTWWVHDKITREGTEQKGPFISQQAAREVVCSTFACVL